MNSYGLLGAYAAGILLGRFAPGLFTGSTSWLLAGLVTSCWLLFGRTRLGWLPILTGIGLCAALLTVSDLDLPAGSHHIARFAGNDPVIFEARVVSLETRADQGQRVVLEALSVQPRADQATTVRGRIQLNVGTGQIAAAPGQVIRLRTRLRIPRRFGTPGEFDYPLHLAGQGIHASVFIKEAQQVMVLPTHAATEAAFWETMRAHLAQRIDSALDPDAAALVKALTVGMRAGVSDPQRMLLSEGGVSHLFAISGLHFGLLGLLLYSGCSWLYRRSTTLILRLPPKRILPVCLIAPLACYLCLTGNSWSTARAFSMAAIGALLLLSQRRAPPLAILSTTALLLLCMTPLALFQPGFQLSFAGLAGILAWVPRWQTRISGLPLAGRWPLMVALSTSAATLATAPFVLWHFHLLSTAALPANLLAIPLIAWGAVPVCLVGAISNGFAPDWADLAFRCAAVIIEHTLKGVAWLTSLPGMGAVYYPLTVAEMLALSTLLAGALWQVKNGWISWARLILPVVVFLVVDSQSDQPGTSLQIRALSVGQGDATLISMSGNRHYLIDGGGLPGSRIDPGQRLIAPALGRLGVRQLNAVLLTHDHPDHRDGLLYILQQLPVREFWSAIPLTELFPPLSRAIEQRGIFYRQLQPGWQQMVDDHEHFLNLFTPGQHAKDLNDRSIVVLTGDLHNRAILTGDLGPHGLEQLVTTGQTGPVGLLKIPHHGSRHSQPERFLGHFPAKLAFVSAGTGNSYGFPHQDTLQVCSERGIPLYRTDRDGTLTFTSHPGGWLVRPETQTVSPDS